MAHISNVIKTPSLPVSATLFILTNRVASAMSKFRAKQAPKTDIAHLSEFTDAELADIGLLRSELSEALFESAADAQAEAMLRVYR